MCLTVKTLLYKSLSCYQDGVIMCKITISVIRSKIHRNKNSKYIERLELSKVFLCLLIITNIKHERIVFLIAISTN